MNQCGNRGRTFHRVRQPYVQRELRRFTHRTNEQADTGDRQHVPIGAGEADRGQVVAGGKHVGIAQAAAVGKQQADAEHEAEVTHAVDQERLHVGVDGRRALEPEADQQVRHQTHRFPTKEQLQEVVAHHEHQHREGEQRDVREETVVAVVFRHVADGVDVHHQRDEGHHAHHHRRKRIDEEADFHLQRAHRHPFIDGAVVTGAIDNVGQRQRRQNEGDRNTKDGDAVGCRAADLLAKELGAEQPGDRRAGQRRERDRQQQVGIERGSHGTLLIGGCGGQPFRLSRSSTLMVSRLRNSTTRMARPIADSAAATVRMKNTNTCPARSPK